MKMVYDTLRPKIYYLLFSMVMVLIFIIPDQLLAQDHHGQVMYQKNDHGYFRLSVVIGHTLIPSLVDGKKENLLVPSWGMDIEYWMNHRWGIGFHNDIEVETFEVLSPGQEYIERVYPLVFTLDALWRPWKGLVLLAGPGIEFERNENLELVRLGAEYEIDIFDSWDLSPNFFYDARFEAFDTWSIGLGVGKRF